jgi:hypothetical protein
MSSFLENPCWDVKEKVDKDGVFVEYEYFYKQIKCHKEKLDSKLIKNYEGYILIERDIRNIDVWLRLLLEYLHKIYGDKIPKIPRTRTKGKEDLHDIIKALFISSITIYGKLFTKSNGRNAKLEKEILKDNFELIKFHEKLMEQRHNFAAHSGNLKMEGVFVYLLIDPIRERKTIPEIVREIFQPDSPSLEEIEIFRRLINFISIQVNNKLSEIYNRINSNILKKGEELWHSLII